MNNYCVFCQSKQEARLAGSIERMGFECLIPYANRTVVINSEGRIEKRKLLPSYVFFRAASLDDNQRIAISRLDYVIRILCYEDSDCALTGRDSEFVDWLWKSGGVLDVSRAYREGDKIRILDGPLKEFEAQIIQVNLKRRSVAIRVSDSCMLGKIWCSVDLVERLGDMQG